MSHGVTRTVPKNEVNHEITRQEEEERQHKLVLCNECNVLAVVRSLTKLLLSDTPPTACFHLPLRQVKYYMRLTVVANH